MRTGLRQLAMNKSLMCIKNLNFICQNGGSQTEVYVPLGVHLGFSRGTLLCERISLFKLNSLSGSNNRLNCLEFSNPVLVSTSNRTIKKEDFFTDHRNFGFEWGKFAAAEKGRVFIF